MQKHENYLTILNYDSNIFEIVNYLKHHILKKDCAKLEIDISRLNMLDASKIAILCSTYYFTKYQNGEIRWNVSDLETKKIIHSMTQKEVIVNIVDKFKSKVLDMGEKQVIYC